MAKHPRDDDSPADDDADHPKSRERRSRPRYTPAQDVHMQQHVQMQPLARSLETKAVPLPDVVAPSLEGLEIHVQSPPPVSQDELVARLHDLLYQAGDKRRREPDEAVQLGDEVDIDVLGYAAGKLIPFSARTLVMELAPLPMLPGLAEGIAGFKVGGGGIVSVRLPDNYPATGLAGLPARFVVDVKAAWEVHPADPADPEQLKKLGLGDTLDAVMDNLAAAIDDEKGQALLIAAAERTLDALAARVTEEIPGEIVNEEIVRQWGGIEGQFLASKGFSDDELREALERWQTDGVTRAEAINRIKAALALKAIAERDGLTVEQEDARDFVRHVFEDTDFKPSAVKNALRTDRTAARAAILTAFQLKVIEHVMAHTRVVVDD